MASDTYMDIGKSARIYYISISLATFESYVISAAIYLLYLKSDLVRPDGPDKIALRLCTIHQLHVGICRAVILILVFVCRYADIYLPRQQGKDIIFISHLSDRC